MCIRDRQTSAALYIPSFIVYAFQNFSMFTSLSQSGKFCKKHFLYRLLKHLTMLWCIDYSKLVLLTEGNMDCMPFESDVKSSEYFKAYIEKEKTLSG